MISSCIEAIGRSSSRQRVKKKMHQSGRQSDTPGSQRTMLVLLALLTCNNWTSRASAVSVEEALLVDLVPDGDSPSSCSDPGTTDITFDFPGVNPSSGWHAPFLQYESGLFLAQMQHTDEADPDKSWTLRFGQGGNIYSHHTDLFGEAIPPQTHDQAPWVDELSLIHI